MTRKPAVALPALLLIVVLGAYADAQSPGARASAPKDYTGYFVSVVAEHWHLRMMVPPKGDFTGLPLNAEARRIANAWDPAKEPPGDGQCKSYGAAAIMRVPGRLHIHWADDNTLQIDTDAGTQTRLVHFGGAAPPGKDLGWQGHSVASWDGAELKVLTTRMRAGYLRKNGIPYSENATLEEYFSRFKEPNGDDWLVIDSIVRDPQYLAQPDVTSVAFKKLPNASGWDPTPCRADQPR